ncbi:MAG: Zn-ribbon domain-containing OB-fold protein [Candidatus Methanofastidiosia archaeon]|jgi:uncharacterized OB-fold protein
MDKFAGERLSSKDMEKVTHEKWNPAVKYAWSCGEAMSRFLNELKKGKLIGRKCNKCKRVIFPPKMFCEFCYRPTDEWVYLPDTGTVMTYSLSYLDKDANRIEEPILVGVIAIDGASENMGLMHYFGEMDPDDLDFGMHVKAVWKPEKEREGSVNDIKYFKPVEG